MGGSYFLRVKGMLKLEIFWNRAWKKFSLEILHFEKCNPQLVIFVAKDSVFNAATYRS
jgi:hypothetical protein